ncbi:MAG: hypothetical protein HY075_11410 [Deltaproteobacteria bacterium]|nr:hypothetical protein [Deltaproteobacteria bacterium]
MSFFKTHTFHPIPGKIPNIDPKVIGPQLATSYTTDRDARYFSNGRDGYSVKLVPFKMLVAKPGKIDENGTSWLPVRFDADAMDDVQKLAH